MAEVSIMKIDGVEAPAPSDFSPTYSTYDSKNSKRSETLKLNREVVRRDLRSHTFSWKLKTPDARKLLSMVAPDVITVSCFDLLKPADDPYSEYQCYADTTRTVKLIHWDRNDPENSWWEIKLDFIEY